MDDELVADGRVARLEIAGRRTGLVRPVSVGFVQAADGSLFVAATDADAAWAANLLAAGTAIVTIGDRSMVVDAEPLEIGDPRRSAAVRDLILRYGTPSEGLGRGPVFVLKPRG